MKNIIQAARALIIAAIITTGLKAQAETITYSAKTGSLLKISGTSSVHDWEVKTLLIGGKMVWDSSFPLDPSKANLPKLTTLPKVSVIVPVRNIESGKQRMNEVMHGAMNAQKHKYARYNLTEMKVTDSKRKAGDPILFDTKGTLNVNGKSVPVSMQVSISEGANGNLKVSGKTKLRMSQFGISPPAPKIALGLITTGDEVSVEFDWFVALKK
ncbi:MAG: YceI family protein [Verrucomicrobiota bacterium]|nr:YceI family protein [Verrucomicrobiota bacterium]